MSKLTDRLIEIAFSIFYPLTEIISISIIAAGLCENSDEWNNERIADEAVDLYKSIIISKEIDENET